MKELQEQGVLVVEIPASATKMMWLDVGDDVVLPSDVGKFHTYMIHISKIMITRDHHY